MPLPPWAGLSPQDAALLPPSTWSSPLVVPCHDLPPDPSSPTSYDVYVGRPGPGGLRFGAPCPWGNPHHTDRYPHLPASLRLYAATIDHLRHILHPAQTALRLRAHHELAGRRLGCWCPQPGPCHAHNWAWVLTHTSPPPDATPAAAPAAP